MPGPIAPPRTPPFPETGSPGGAGVAGVVDNKVARVWWCGHFSCCRGGSSEPPEPTTGKDPTYDVPGVPNFCVTNIPGPVPQPAPLAISAVIFSGATPAPYSNYLEDRQTIGLSVTGTLNNNFRLGASYNNFFGSGLRNKAKDQDFTSLTASYSF